MTRPGAHIPPGYSSLTPYLIVDGAERLFDFLVRSFDGEVADRSMNEDGTVSHGAVRIGASIVEFSEARPEWPAQPSGIHVYVPDTDAAYTRAMDNGAETLYPPSEMPYGERSAGVRDPTGSSWYIATYGGGESAP